MTGYKFSGYSLVMIRPRVQRTIKRWRSTTPRRTGPIRIPATASGAFAAATNTGLWRAIQADATDSLLVRAVRARPRRGTGSRAVVVIEILSNQTWSSSQIYKRALPSKLPPRPEIFSLCTASSDCYILLSCIIGVAEALAQGPTDKGVTLATRAAYLPKFSRKAMEALILELSYRPANELWIITPETRLRYDLSPNYGRRHLPRR